MLLHLVSAIIAILQFSSAFSAGGEAQLGGSTGSDVMYPEPLYTECKGGLLYDHCQHAINTLWSSTHNLSITYVHQYTPWIKGCKVTYWTLDYVQAALSSVQGDCPSRPVPKVSDPVTGFRNLFIGRLTGGGRNCSHVGWTVENFPIRSGFLMSTLH
ncbi:hypothetical protein CROQUDRAFT_268729 [Cronartium quercuum f. sp. fusiforme G11]|uniref:Uncharacterized protein n=1 Tax=Cronartium quercuum f. sp. fusiforme G11 TaxID=708437 RepID=A0A9P6NCQ3_9BASI|nr:hypothetical protein CROQUDRAFT_268729 [Cronartium quercuum f. sp. fusiforme G11]